MGRYPLGSNLVQKGVRPLVENLEVLNDFGQKVGQKVVPKGGPKRSSHGVKPWIFRSVDPIDPIDPIEGRSTDPRSNHLRVPLFREIRTPPEGSSPLQRVYPELGY